MKVLVVTGSRADRNGLEVVHEALLDAGHGSRLHNVDDAIGDRYDIALVGGDRIEILEGAVRLARSGIPIAHIAGGDVTRGSADDRYRNAITALACIHFATNDWAYDRLCKLVQKGDVLEMTGSPAIDRIMRTPVNLNRSDVLSQFCMHGDKPVALACVHPNTVGDDPLKDYRATVAAVHKSGLQCVWLGSNADPGGDRINEGLALLCSNQVEPMWSFRKNVSPSMYYSLMTHCDVMVGNSSAMLYEAPCFGIPCVLVGDRQRGRIIPRNVVPLGDGADVSLAVKAMIGDRFDCPNPYGDGRSAPRIVKALEEWHELRQGVGGRARVAGDAV